MSLTTDLRDDLLNEWLQFESYFSDNNYNPKKGQLDLSLDHSHLNSSKFLFCAPHALNHYRNNNLKVADVFTGSLCQLLAIKTNQSVLISTRPDTGLEYLGFGRDYIGQIKNAVNDGLIVVDIHGMSDRHNLDICIGTGPNPSKKVISFVDRMIIELPGYKISVNYPFSAKSDHTITNFVQTKLSGDSIQIEIAARLRRADSDSGECTVFLNDISNFFENYLY